MPDDHELIYLDGTEGMRDIAADRSRRIIEASRPLAELLMRDDRMAVPPELQIHSEGIYDGMPEAIYHADPVPEGSLTRSGANLLLPPGAPAKYDYWLRHPGDRYSSDVFDLGSAAHHMVLGIGPELVDVGYTTFRPPGKGNVTRLNKVIEEARARGAIPLRSQDWDRVMAMAAALRAHTEAAALLDPDRGKPEQAIFWIERVVWKGADDEMHEAEVWRRGLIDWLPDAPAHGRLIVPDYKTSDTAHQDSWARTHVNKYGYHMQDQWVTEGLQRLLGIEVAVIFILQEKEPPFLVSIAELGAPEKRAGYERNWAALEVYAECRRTDRWPGYPTFKTVALPWLDR